MKQQKLYGLAESILLYIYIEIIQRIVLTMQIILNVTYYTI